MARVASRPSPGFGGRTSRDTPVVKGVARVRILVLGGDGYLGWPTALHLSRRGHDVGVVDNFVRRQYDHEMGVDSLVPITQLQHRVRIWEEVSGLRLETFIGDLTDPVFVDNTLERFEPE